MAYPSTITALTNPTPNETLAQAAHSSIEGNQNTEITALETFIGTTNTSAVGTILYDVRAPGSDGGGHIQSANKGGTGQTAYTKGDLIAAKSSSVLSKLAVGADGSYLKADSTAETGLAWSGFSAERITTTQVWQKPGGLAGLFVIAVGGGGSGGFGAASSIKGAGGGGGGATKVAYIDGSIIPSSVLITVAQSVAGGTASSQNGKDNGYSSFGNFVFAGGGAGGAAGTNASVFGGGGGACFGSASSTMGGNPSVIVAALGPQGPCGNQTGSGLPAEWGGGSGGYAHFDGGDSYYSAGGGGGGGTNSGGSESGGNGGGVGYYSTGNGPAGGATNVSGTSGRSASTLGRIYGGEGGGGGGMSSNGLLAAGNGGDGGFPGGGGGGGGGGGIVSGGLGGDGAAGLVTLFKF